MIKPGCPSTAETIVVAVLLAIALIILAIFATYCIAEWWRTRRGSTKYYWAYGDGDTCNVKFITGSDYRK